MSTDDLDLIRSSYAYSDAYQREDIDGARALAESISCCMAASAPALSSTAARDVPVGGTAGEAGRPAAAARLAAGGAESGGDLEPRPGAARLDLRAPARFSISGTEHCRLRPPPCPRSTPDEAQSANADSSPLESVVIPEAEATGLTSGADCH